MSKGIRLVDLDEQHVVVMLSTDGKVEVLGDMCTVGAAALLMSVARQLVAEHGVGSCRREPEPQHERPAEPLHAHAGSLDREARVWTDGTGHAWDLALAWRDATDQSWRWHGSVDRQGAPIMRSADGSVSEPLDVVRAVYGPLAPEFGGVA
ncbi:phiSA1p31-related protein [Streptomyces sp. NPDC050145]|uniref:phiSA1p31-related protein n=1 Tax=Streptomyces sp. NPDC050145 TaxID=3365602 RepID=UPI0037AC7077